MESYSAIYSDTRGTEETVISNDGETLRITIRGVEFAGTMFDDFEPGDGVERDRLEMFTLCRNELCSCRIGCMIPIPMIDNGCLSDGALDVEIILGEPLPDGRLDREEIHITLICDRGEFRGSGQSGWFEDELLEIQAQLPESIYMKACINCLYSDYSPYGHGTFGGMMCYRNLKAEYIKVKTKDDFWPIHGLQDRFVQETFLCPEFERRVPGTGYRG